MVAAYEPRTTRLILPVQGLTLALGVALLGHSGCLKLNDDYSYPKGSQDPRDEFTSPEVDTTTQGTSGTHTPATAAISTQQSSDPAQVSTSDQSQDNSTPNNTSSSGTTSTTTTTTSDPGPGEPGPGSRWIPFTVHNPSNSQASGVGTSASLTFNHASLISAGAHAKGEDLRIYTVRGGIKTQLHRVLDPASAWGRSDTRIWFKLDGTLNATQTESKIYHLVLDANTSNPAQDPQQVFLFYDDFNAPNPSLDGWAVNRSGTGGMFDTVVSGGQLVMSARASSRNVVRNALRSTKSLSVPGLVLEASVGWDDGTRFGCTEEIVLGLWSPDTMHKRALWSRRDHEWYLVNRGSNGSEYYQDMSAGPANGNLRRRRTYWSKNAVSMYTDNGFSGSLLPRLTGFTSPADGPLILGFEVGADGAICSDTSRLRVDWVYARLLSSVFDIESKLQLGDAFVAP